MDYKKVYNWFTFDMLVFVGINAFLLYRFGDRLTTLTSIGFYHLLVLGLAAFRGSNIVSNEVVTKPLRAPFVNEVEKDGKMIEEPKKTGFLGATGVLIYCPSCTGVWIAAALAYGYILWPTVTFFVALILAMSGIERIIAGILGGLKRTS